MIHIRVIEWICATIVMVTFLICLAYIFTPTEWTFAFMIDDESLEAFKLIYNCS